MLSNQKSKLILDIENGIIVANFENYTTIDERNTAQIKIDIEELLATGQVNFVFDLNGVNYFSSVFLGCLATIFNSTKSANGMLRICCVSEPLKRILRITKMDKVLNVDETREDALNCFE